MQRLLLTGRVLPAGARLVIQHIFKSEEAKPIEVIYSFPLPRDAALRRFRITGEGFEAVSELKETEVAVKEYEEGIAKGSLSTLARQYGDGVINLTVGNIRPRETVTVWLEILAGVELKDDGFRFRFPFTLAPTYHAGAKVAMVSPGEGEMELPAAEFGDVILPRFRENLSALHQIGFDLSLASQLEFSEIGSPSHAVRIKQDGGRAAGVALATGQDVPNRDLVLDGRYKSVSPQILAGRDKDGIGRFAAIVPSTSFGSNPEAPRRVVILLDRSGSMGGEPIAQARKAIEACLGVLSESDSFGLVAFDNVPEEFHSSLQPATRDVREKARAFLQQVNARGGTELVSGFLAAAKLLAGGGGDILIMTDGQVSGTETILESARSANVRLHCLGIGSASQDRFLTLLARETGGVSRFVTPRERVDLSAVDLFASIGRPIASGLQTGSNVQPQPPSMVFAGTPLLLFGEGDGPVELTWDGGRLNVPLSFADNDGGETVWLLQGSRLITDWESRYPGAEALAPLEKRKQSRVAMRLVELSKTYGLASREMSLVAVVKRAGDRPGDLPETQVVPVGMAQDTAFGAYFQNVIMAGASLPPGAPAPGKTHRLSPQLKLGRVHPGTPAPIPAQFTQAMMSPPPPPMPAAAPPPSPAMDKPGRLDRFTKFFQAPGQKLPAKTAENAPERTREKTPEDVLLDLASQMESDGGMPGKNPDDRAASSAVALLAFLSQGHSPSSGAFRSHVTRLVKFLQSLTSLSDRHQKAIAAVVQAAGKGNAPAGDWIGLASGSGPHWRELEAL
jgi:Ca-activated chloride channel family protein